ncbi:MAG: type II secretion system major pseudopilin GspG [Caulobacterales bacterium]|jgi:general secretion pathway protein G
MPHRNPRAGYTLTELLVVLVILGLLTALVAPRVLEQIGRAKTRAAAADVKAIAAALDLYRLEVGAYPDPAIGLRGLIDRPAGVANWSGPYLQKAAVPRDPWDRPYLYILPADGAPLVESHGRDGKEGGDGEDRDVSNR